MPSSKSDFASPTVKTVGCFALMLSPLGVMAITVAAGRESPHIVYPLNTIIWITAISLLCGRPGLVSQVLDVATSVFGKR